MDSIDLDWEVALTSAAINFSALTISSITFSASFSYGRIALRIDAKPEPGVAMI